MVVPSERKEGLSFKPTVERKLRKSQDPTMAYLKPRDAQPIAIHLPKQHQIFEAGDKYTVHTTT